MNKRYRELEKKVIDARRTYEKLAKKSDKLESEKSKFETRVSKSKSKYEELKRKSDNECSEEDYKLIHTMLTHRRELTSKFGANFIEETIDEIEALNNELIEKNTLCNELFADGKRIAEELNKKEHGFKALWNSKSDIITEDYAKEFIKKYNVLDEKRKQIYEHTSQLIYERDLAIKKIEKLNNKAIRYNELISIKEDLVEKLCKHKSIKREAIVSYISNVQDMYKQQNEQMDRYEMLNGLLQEYNSEMDQLRFKLSVSKDKMEEAEYQFREYKGLIGAA